MDDWIDIRKDEAHCARERVKARELRQTNWWRTLISKGICHYCGKHFPPEALTMDHVVPLARGGRSTKGNIVCACKACNSKKKYTVPADEIINQILAENPDIELRDVPEKRD